MSFYNYQSITMMRAILVFWCLTICVKGDTTGYDVVNPTPVVKSASVIQTTDALSPFKVNNQEKPEFYTTSIAAPNDEVLVNPTPVLPAFEVTDAANPLSNEDVLVIKRTDANNLVSPSSVITVPNIKETNAGNPLDTTPVINMPIIKETNAESSLNPSPIINVPIIVETNANNPVDSYSMINVLKVTDTMAGNPINPSFMINVPGITETHADGPVSPSPLINVPVIMETNADKPLTSSSDIPVMMETIASNPFIPIPVMNSVKITETNVENPLNPSSVIDVPSIQETNVNKPLFFNNPENSILTTTAYEEDFKPTPVVIIVADLDTTSVEINNDTPEQPLSSTWSLIEPSQVFDIKSSDVSSTTDVATPNLESQKPIDEASTESPPKAESTIKPCICSYYTDSTETTIPELLSDVLEDALIPHFPAPEKPKMDKHITIFQRLINLQINYVINNFPVLEAHPPPFFIQPR